jgi:hypothetical protein
MHPILNMIKNLLQLNLIIMKYGIEQEIQIELFMLAVVLMLMKIQFVQYLHHLVT